MFVFQLRLRLIISKYSQSAHPRYLTIANASLSSAAHFHNWLLFRPNRMRLWDNLHHLIKIKANHNHLSVCNQDIFGYLNTFQHSQFDTWAILYCGAFLWCHLIQCWHSDSLTILSTDERGLIKQSDTPALMMLITVIPSNTMHPGVIIIIIILCTNLNTA